MASGGNSEVKDAFDKYARFGKTEAQLKEKDIRLNELEKLDRDDWSKDDEDFWNNSEHHYKIIGKIELLELIKQSLKELGEK